ncbi:MAG: DHA2 family efflux MFS transporter permease subunit [Solirubrobacteraceae bacterium]
MSLFIVGLDNTAVNVALPSIRQDLHASVSGLQWTIDAYTLVLASLLMLSGSTADRLGRRRVFQIGLALFSLGSLLCSLAPGVGWLVAFRMVQAVGGSMLNPVAMSIIRQTFTDARERAAAIGVWGGVVGLSLAMGPLLGGALTDGLSWRAIFWINIPVGLAAIVLTARFVPESRAARARRVDLVGQGLVIVGLASLTGAIIEGPKTGWGSPFIVGLFVLAAVSLVSLVAYELRRFEPLIDPRFFRSAPFSGASIIAISSFAALGGFLFLTTLYLQEVRGFSALHAGLYTLPLAGMTLIFGPVSGRLVGRIGPRPSLLLGGGGIALGSALLTGLSASTSSSLLIAAYLAFGIGFGLINPPITNTAVSGMPAEQAGVAAAVASTSRQVGQTLGVAIAGAVAAGGLAAAAGPTFAVSSRPAWWLISGCGALAVAVGAGTTTGWARGTARRTAAALTPSVESST